MMLKIRLTVIMQRHQILQADEKGESEMLTQTEKTNRCSHKQRKPSELAGRRETRGKKSLKSK